jgi:MFS family permease
MKPFCGNQIGGTSNTGEDIFKVISILMSIGGGIGTILAYLGKGVLTIIGISAVAAVWAAAALAAVAAIVIVLVFYINNCHTNPEGLRNACMSGVINNIVSSFDTTAELFPFTAQHDRTEVVVKSRYWDLLSLNARYIYCANDVDESPYVNCFYYSDEACGAGLGSTIGVVVGAIGGLIAGVAVGALIAGAACCATVVACLFCLLAILVAIIIVAIVAAVGAFIGGQIGRAAAGSDDPSADGSSEALRIGDYVTVRGNLILNGNLNGARTYWFVESTTLHGQSTNAAPFSYQDPDTNLTMDACPLR